MAGRRKFNEKNIREGSVLGAALLIYNLVLVRLFTRGEYWDYVIKYLLPLVAGFWVLGILLMSFHNKKRRIDKNLYYGAAGMYWLFLIGAALTLFRLAGPLAEWLVYCNLGALFGAWLIEYLYLVRMSEKLNGARGAVRQSLAINLPKRIRDPEKVYDFLEDYCGRNDMNLWIVEKGIPGRARIDGMEYEINVQEYYGFFGTPSYDLLVTSLTAGDL